MERIKKLRRHVTLLVTLSCWTVGKTNPEIRVIEPEFNPVPDVLSYYSGDTARLFCSVSNLGERTIVWRKMPNPSPLTIGTTTWIDDKRLSIDRIYQTKQWNLVIRDVTRADAGKYECQVSMIKRKLRQYVLLKVKDDPVKRNPDLHISGTSLVENGGVVSLYCNASFSGSRTFRLEWFKDGDVLKSDGFRISISPFGEPPSSRKSSLLQIHRANIDDSGIYLCRSKPYNKMTSVQVHVMNAGSNNVKRGPSGSSGLLQGGAGSLGLESRAVGLLPGELYHLLVVIAIITTRLVLS